MDHLNHSNIEDEGGSEHLESPSSSYHPDGSTFRVDTSVDARTPDALKETFSRKDALA